MKNEDCPCVNCICVPVCRQKGYFTLVSECKLILRILYKANYPQPMDRSVHFNRMIGEINAAINPTHWKVDHNSARKVIFT